MSTPDARVSRVAGGGTHTGLPLPKPARFALSELELEVPASDHLGERWFRSVRSLSRPPGFAGPLFQFDQSIDLDVVPVFFSPAGPVN